MYQTKPSSKARNKSGTRQLPTKAAGKKKRLQSANPAKKNKKSPGKFLEHQTESGNQFFETSDFYAKMVESDGEVNNSSFKQDLVKAKKFIYDQGVI